jgi:hypothetical protein
MNDSKMGRGALEHLLQGGGETFETWGDGKSSEVNYQRELNSSEDIIPTWVCNYASKKVLYYSNKWFATMK